MLDTDTLLMKRALELARRGAGLVSPNPMVGAVLVNEGRVVGEGYHRYDLLKHAESYAIDIAGELARGSTLYCNLEPCRHHGRTPPCTDAIIEAGIARAVIAVKDPDRRVNGLGIEQLRDAGIEVEVGALEDRAVLLNESYFKFITRGIPFVHGVIEYPADVERPHSQGASMRPDEWRPSKEFLETASECDALMIGGRLAVSMLVLDEAARRERHRPLIVVSSSAEPGLVKNLPKRVARKISVVPFDTDPAPADTAGKVVRLDEAISHGVARSPIGSLLATLARMNVTSLLAMPGTFDLDDSSNFKELDKATLAIPGSLSDQSLSAQWAFGEIEFDLEDVSVTEAAAYTELTGYPSLRGVA